MGAKAVLLLSGGLDSTTLLAVARRDGFDLHAMTLPYYPKDLTARTRALAARDALAPVGPRIAANVAPRHGRVAAGQRRATFCGAT